MGRQERKTYMKIDGFSELVERMQVPSIPQPYIPPIAPGIAERIATNTRKDVICHETGSTLHPRQHG